MPVAVLVDQKAFREPRHDAGVVLACLPPARVSQWARAERRISPVADAFRAGVREEEPGRQWSDEHDGLGAVTVLGRGTEVYKSGRSNEFDEWSRASTG